MYEVATRLIRSKKNIMYILHNLLRKNKLYIKDHHRKTPVVVNVINDDEIQVFLPLNYNPNSKLALYSMPGRYIELKLNIIKRLNYFSYLAEPVSILISSNRRYYDRYSCKNGFLLASNFKLFDHKVVLNPESIPISAKNILSSYQNILQDLYPNLELGVYSSKDGDKLIDFVYMSKKIIFIEDINDINTYLYYKDGILNKLLFVDDKDFHEINYSLRRKDVKSLLIYPLIIPIGRNKTENIAYIQLSLDMNIDFSSVMAHLNVVSYEIINKLKREITNNYFVEQRVVDLGINGARLYINDGKLNSYLDKNVELSFDLKFKDGFEDEFRDDLLLSFYSNLSYKRDVNNASYVGLVFTGSDHKGFDRLQSLLDFFHKKQSLVKL